MIKIVLKILWYYALVTLCCCIGVYGYAGIFGGDSILIEPTPKAVYIMMLASAIIFGSTSFAKILYLTHDEDKDI